MVELIEDDERRHEGNRVLEPDVLAGYVQLAFDATVLALVIAMVVKFALVVQDDVRCKVQERLAANLRSVADCKRSYELNECLPGMRVPALEESCDKWLHCMNEDVEQLKHGSGSGALWAKTMGEILNSFIDFAHCGRDVLHCLKSFVITASPLTIASYSSSISSISVSRK